MSLKNTMLAGGLVALSGCTNGGEHSDHDQQEGSADMTENVSAVTKYPECGENVYVVKVKGKANRESIGGAKNYDEKFCAIDHSKGTNCEAIKDEANKRIQMILDSYICEPFKVHEGVNFGEVTHYYPHEIKDRPDTNPDYSDLLSVKGTVGDCSEAINEFGFRIREVNPDCNDNGEIYDKGLRMPHGNVR